MRHMRTGKQSVLFSGVRKRQFPGPHAISLSRAEPITVFVAARAHPARARSPSLLRMAALPTLRAPSSRRVGPTHPRARPSRVFRASSANAIPGSSSAGDDRAGPVLIIPGFLSSASKYAGMAESLERLRRFDAVRVVPLQASDWYPTLAGGDFGAILDKIDACASDVLAASRPDAKLLLVGHSAGGWLARAWMGRAPYAGRPPYAGADKTAALLTLGTPHYSLEAYPFGRVRERRDGEGELAFDRSAGASPPPPHPTWTPERAEGSTLALTNLRYPGAHEPGVRYVAACGRGVKGADLARWRPGGAGDVDLSSVGAGVSYRASCGSADVDGDGVTPVQTALLEGATHVVIDGVAHEPGAGKIWYGSPEAVARWAPALLGEAQANENDEAP